MRFTGIYTPIITPFLDDGSIDWDGYADVIEWQIENGVAGIIVGGSTGEFYALSKEERIQQFRFAAERINGRVELMAGVNDIRVEECLEIVAAAKEAGAQSLLVAAPPYSLPSEAELAHHVLKIAEAGLPIMLYNYPGRTGVEMGEEFLSIVSQNPLVCAIKESSGDYSRLPFLARNYPGIELVVGGEEQVLEFAAWGAKAWVCASANIFPAECVKFMEIAASGADQAQARQLMAAFMPLMGILEQGGKFLQCVKHGCAEQGRPSGIVRPPLLPMDDALKQEMSGITAATRQDVNAILNAKG
ncbi:dihydrodipicolinate synthetase [Leisingera sp. ANG-M1]|uniref:dihydrodipicolinate synthase family protein n=1 Tax=Leisingera sp. ANG-M1 TaxID=1577895 RepID=UPI00057F6B4E|nr:dihydrodipicolinate synthase family protein [Leisingera sp. ANG-M1]KIC09036.1 dihydrodipicolinate synthetase [Leisingera sp. ANG-M1]